MNDLSLIGLESDYKYNNTRYYNDVSIQGTLEVLSSHILFGLECMHDVTKHKDAYTYLVTYYEEHIDPSLESQIGENASWGSKLKNFILTLYARFVAGIKIVIEKAKSVYRRMVGDDLSVFARQLNKMAGIKFKNEPVLPSPALAKSWSLQLSASAVVTTHEQVIAILKHHQDITKATAEALKLTLQAMNSINLDKSTLKNENANKAILDNLKVYVADVKKCYPDDIGKWVNASPDKGKTFSSFRSKSLIAGNQLTFVLVEPTEERVSSLVASPPTFKHTDSIPVETIETLTTAVFEDAIKVWEKIGTYEAQLRVAYDAVLQSENKLKSYQRLIESEIQNTSDEDLAATKTNLTHITVLYSNLYTLSDTLAQHLYWVNRHAKNEFLRYVKASKRK